MASFTETARLVVQDAASKPISKINAELRKLAATARSIKSTKIDLGNLGKAHGEVRRLTAELQRLHTAGSRPIPIRLNVSQAQTALAQLRAQSQRPISIATRTTGGGRTAGGLGALGTPARVGVHVLGGVVGLASYSIASLAHAVGRTAREGAKDVDVADTAIALKQMTAQQRTASTEAINQIAREQKDVRLTPSGELLNRAQIQQLYAEALPVAKYDAAGARALTGELIEMIKLGRATGQSFEQARKGAIDFGKALDTMDVLFGEQKDETGKILGKGLKQDQFNAESAARWFNVLRQVAPDIGEEFRGDFVRQAIKYARSARYSMTPRAMAGLLFTAEEFGASSAGVAMNQALKNLSGTSAKPHVIANLKKMGLLTTDEVKKGRVGDKTIMDVVGGDATDAEAQRQNLFQWISDRVIPAMKKQWIADPRAPGGRRLMDPTNKVDVGILAGKITSERTARDFLETAINRAAEIQKQVDIAMARPGDKTSVGKILADSSLIAATSVKNQIESVLGETINKLEPALLPVMKGASGILSGITEEIRKAQPEAVAGGTVAGGVAAAAALVGLYKLARPLGVVSALAGATEEQSRPLSLAALALQGAAADLSSAADKLSGGTGIAPLGGPDKPGGKPESTTKSVAKSIAATVAAVTRTGAALALPGAMAYLSSPLSDYGKIMQDAERSAMAVALAHADLYGANQKLTAAEQALAAARTPGEVARWSNEVAALQGRIASVTALIEQIEPPDWVTTAAKESARPVPSATDWIAGAVQAIKQQALPSAESIKALRATEFKPKPWPELPPLVAPMKDLATAAGRIEAGGIPFAQAATSLATTSTTMTSAASTLAQGGIPFTSAVSSLAASSNTFAVTFQTGAAAITTAAQTAGTTLQSMAPNIGSIIGNAAGNALAARAAGIAVNINVQGDKASTGAQKPVD